MHPDPRGEVGRHRPARRPVFEAGNLSEIVFLTVCSAGRKPVLARPDVHAVLVDAWQVAAAWLVGRYVILPDHVHLFCSPDGVATKPIRRWVAYWKSLAARSWPRPSEHPVWQLDAWDTQLRSGDSYGAKWDYVRQNPVRHGLVATADQWPYQGELNILPWHDR